MASAFVSSIILSFDRLQLNLCEMGIESYTIPPVPGIINKQAARKHFYRF